MPLPRTIRQFRKSSPFLSLAALAALGLAAAPAHAGGTTVLNFDTFSAATATESQFIGPTYDAQGFTLTSGSDGFYAFNGSDPTFGDGETSLFSDNATSVTLTQDNGRAFSLNAIDLGPYAGNPFGPYYAGPVTFTGTKVGGGTVTASETMDDPNGQFQTFTFTSFTDLTSLTFTGNYNSDPNGGVAQFDNVALTPAPVPEASSAVGLGLMLALGLAGVAVLRRKGVKA